MKRRPRVGDVAHPSDPGNVGELFHWTRAAEKTLRSKGLTPGAAQAKGAGAPGHARGRVFFSADKTKWKNPGDLLVRVLTDAVMCRYDGGEYVGDSERKAGQLVDCFVEGAVPASRLSFGRRPRKSR